jgi:dGTPase
LLEVQVVDLADSIAYDAHDADDALELGLLTADDLFRVPLWREACERVERRRSGLSDRQRRRAVVHETIDWQVSDAIENTTGKLAENKIESVEDVRRSAVLVIPSIELFEKKQNLERFLFDKVYRHPRVVAEREPAQRAVREMFELLTNEPEKLPPKFRRLAETEGILRATGDYLAGMTDRFALDEHQRLVKR